MLGSLQLSPSAERANRLLTALGEARTDVLQLIAELNEPDLAAPTICPGWSVRAQLGHILDATEMLDESLKSSSALMNIPPRPAEMAEAMSRAAKNRAATLSISEIHSQFEALSQELLNRLDSFNYSDWETSLPHPYLGHCPAVQFAGFTLLDWFIHPHDIRAALNLPNTPRPDHAALLVAGLIGLLPRRLNSVVAGDKSGRFRFIMEKPGTLDEIALSMDVILSNCIVYIERDVAPSVTADLTFRGQPAELALAMLGRKPLTQRVLPAPTNEQWLPIWPNLWISL
jgi:uncharacterized protein (TIGR03083 family)